MHTIALTTQKGGSGKSTLAVGLAMAAREAGHNVRLIETDRQGTLTNWQRRRGAANPLVETVYNGRELESRLRFERLVSDLSATFATERDTRAAMKDYLSSFDPHLKGLTGDPAAVQKVITEYRVYAKKVPLKDGDYTMDHTALIYLMDRDGRFVSPFNINRKPEEAASDLKRYL